MWLEAFHLLTCAIHGYTISYLLCINYTEVTDKYVIAIRDMGFRFLTVWNLITQTAYFSSCTMEYVLRAVLRDSSPFLNRWQKLRETVFQAIVFPMGLFVSCVFWVLFNYDRSVVYPETVDRYIAPYVNHLMHTCVGVLVVLEMLLRPHYYHHRARHLGILLLYCCSYLACYSYTYWTRGVWIYPLYYQLSSTQQFLMNIHLTFVTPSACYLLGEKVAHVVWGKQTHQTKGEKKRL